MGFRLGDLVFDGQIQFVGFDTSFSLSKDCCATMD